MRVRVDAGGREVEIEAPNDAPLHVVAAQAFTLWMATEGATTKVEASGMGFVTETRPDRESDYGLDLAGGEPMPVRAGRER